MLAAMGLRLWTPPPAAAPAAAVAALAEEAESAAAGRAAAQAAVAADAAPARPAAVPAAAAPAPAAAEPRPPAPRPAHLEAARAAALGARAPGVTSVAAAAAAVQATLSDPAMVERAAAIATLDWPALKAAVAQCTACGLCASRKQTVFGVGHAQADWMIVGEAPGEQEDLQGEPFVGPAGQLLDQMLRAVGQSRFVDGQRADELAGDPARRVFIANTLKCRPPRNRNPEPDEMARCEPFLQRQLALVRPRIILAMGRFAVKQLLRSDEAIGRLRGRVHRYEGVPVIVTYHPAYLLRNLPDKAKAWEDLCLARRVADEGAAG
jgi:DNA polymerase